MRALLLSSALGLLLSSPAAAGEALMQCWSDQTRSERVCCSYNTVTGAYRIAQGTRGCFPDETVERADQAAEQEASVDPAAVGDPTGPGGVEPPAGPGPNEPPTTGGPGPGPGPGGGGNGGGGGGGEPPEVADKGNNGVGNGVDPQPPGNPPVNDGAPTGPGQPDNRGGPNGNANANAGGGKH